MSDNSEYRELFVQEANEHVQQLNDNVLKLEETPDNKEFLDAAFRSAHTIKGLAASMGYEPIRELCFEVEELFDNLRKNEGQLSSDVASVLFKCFDALDEMIKNDKNQVDIQSLIKQIKNPQKKTTDSDIKTTQKKTTKLDSGSVSQEKLATIRVKSEDLDAMVNLVGEIMITKMRLEEELSQHPSDEIQKSVRSLATHISQLQSKTMEIRLISLEESFNRYPRMVRDIAQNLEKEIKFEMDVQGIELDRTVVEAINDPLIHMLRNSVDHGIEKPSDRKIAGKSEVGTIKLSAFRIGEKVAIQVKDDGKGIDLESIKTKSIQKGLITSTENISNDSLIELLGTPGLSTAEKVTDISGRGVGFNVVKSQIEKIGGQIKVETDFGHWTEITMILPMSLAIIGGLLISVQDNKFVIPISSIDSMIQLEHNQVKKVKGKDMLVYRDEVIPIMWLRDILGLSDKKTITKKDVEPVILVKKDDKRYGLVIDGYEGRHEFVIKQLDQNIRSMLLPNATILSDGQVALILDPINIIQMTEEE